jgi:transposase-like protein
MRDKMNKKPHGSAFKFKVAIAAIKGDKTTAELCQEYGIVSSQLFKWRKTLLEGGEVVFKNGSGSKNNESEQIDKLHSVIGRLKVENDFLEKFAGRNL